MTIVDITTFGAGAAFLSHWIVNGLTLAQPERPSWLAFVASAVLSILFTFLLTLANVPATFAFDRNVIAQVVLVGLLGAAGAGGASVTQAAAEAKRQRAMSPHTPPEPDPVTPRAMPKEDHS
jgi:hypothetical protein